MIDQIVENLFELLFYLCRVFIVLRVEFAIVTIDQATGKEVDSPEELPFCYVSFLCGLKRFAFDETEVRCRTDSFCGAIVPLQLMFAKNILTVFVQKFHEILSFLCSC